MPAPQHHLDEIGGEVLYWLNEFAKLSPREQRDALKVLNSDQQIQDWLDTHPRKEDGNDSSNAMANPVVSSYRVAVGVGQP